MNTICDGRPGETRLMQGNEAFARGALEAGLSVAAGYPGTPSSEISLNLFQVSRESDLYFEYSTNEKVSMEVAAAAANANIRSMCIMKHVGLNVAADVFMTLAYVGVKAGMDGRQFQTIIPREEDVVSRFRYGSLLYSVPQLGIENHVAISRT